MYCRLKYSVLCFFPIQMRSTKNPVYESFGCFVLVVRCINFFMELSFSMQLWPNFFFQPTQICLHQNVLCVFNYTVVQKVLRRILLLVSTHQFLDVMRAHAYLAILLTNLYYISISLSLSMKGVVTFSRRFSPFYRSFRSIPGMLYVWVQR